MPKTETQIETELDSNVEEKEEAGDYLRFRLPTSLKERYKLFCYLKGDTMSDRIRGLIEKDISSVDMEELLAQQFARERELKLKKGQPALV